MVLSPQVHQFPKDVHFTCLIYVVIQDLAVLLFVVTILIKTFVKSMLFAERKMSPHRLPAADLFRTRDRKKRWTALKTIDCENKELARFVTPMKIGLSLMQIP